MTALMPTTDRKLRVFLCHSSQDKPIVRELYQRLLAEGWINPWLDEEKLLPGQDWDMEIEKAVEAADAVIVCLSNSSVTKEGYVQKELKRVLDVADSKPDEVIFIIPVRLDDCEVPRRLVRWHYEDNFPKQRQFDAYKRIIVSLKLRAEAMGINPSRTPLLNVLDASGNDILLQQAILVAKSLEKITISRLQRNLRVSYPRAVTLIEKMVEVGVLIKEPDSMSWLLME